VTTKNLLIDQQSEKLNKFVDKVLNQILGREATEIIYAYLESKHSIRRWEIAEKLNSFNSVLEEYLGTGAFVIEKVISDSLEESRDIDLVERNKILKLA